MNRLFAWYLIITWLSDISDFNFLTVHSVPGLVVWYTQISVIRNSAPKKRYMNFTWFQAFCPTTIVWGFQLRNGTWRRISWFLKGEICVLRLSTQTLSVESLTPRTCTYSISWKFKLEIPGYRFKFCSFVRNRVQSCMQHPVHVRLSMLTYRWDSSSFRFSI